jgi:hypothetical protein
MILIFDTYAGLCNQFYDIQCAINFCLIHNIEFSFRYASFRNNDLISWYNVPFHELFDTSFLKKYDLYIDYNQLYLKLNYENTFNFHDTVCCNRFLSRENILEQLLKINKSCIILKQFWDIYAFKEIREDINRVIIPSSKIMRMYNQIKIQLSLQTNNYNFFHYRYEHDFIRHFKIKNMKSLKEIISEKPFLNKDLKIYIATTNLKQLLKEGNIFEKELKDIILYKNEDSLENWNFEEKAFIDYMIGLNSLEVLGHHNSSFSVMLNNLKGTNNYYG